MRKILAGVLFGSLIPVALVAFFHAGASAPQRMGANFWIQDAEPTAADGLVVGGVWFSPTTKRASLLESMNPSVWSVFPAVLSGTSAGVGGSLLAAGGCATVDTTINGAQPGMVSTAEPTTYPGAGIFWQSRVISSNTVRVYVCTVLLATPTNSTYAIKVIQ